MTINTNELIQKAQMGCEESMNVLLKKNENLVRRISNQYRTHEKEEVFQVGMITLYECIKKFDKERGVQFSSYAFPCINGQIKKYFRDNKQMKIYRTTIENANKIKQYCQKYESEHYKNPTMEEIKKELKLTTKEVMEATYSQKMCISLDYSFQQDDDEHIYLKDRLAVEEKSYRRLEERDWIKEQMKSLNEKEKKLLYYRFVLEEKQQDIGKRMGISQVHVSRMEKKILRKLKDGLLKTAI